MSTQLHVVFGTGPVGQAVIRELRVRGHRVRAVSRSGRAELDADVEMLSGDAGDPSFANHACIGASVVYSALNPPTTVRVMGNPDLPHTYSYIDDIGRGLVTLGEDSRACGQVCHLPDSSLTCWEKAS